jgi:hypothetical protein
MTDAEFVDELVARLNLLLKADADRANAVFGTPLAHAAYASVGHFVGQLAMPRHITREASVDDVQNVKFVAPVVEDRRIMKFEAVTGAELQKRHAKAAQGASDGSGTH